MGEHLKIAVFGLGKIFSRNWQYIDKRQVVCLVDNDKEKIGKHIDGIEVIPPERLNEFAYDAVLLMSLDYNKMRAQLVGLGISENKIFNYTEMGDVREVIRNPILLYSDKQKNMFVDWLKCHRNKKRVLLISHELSYSGAPIALMNMAKVMQKMGFSVLYVSLEDGGLKKELEINSIAHIFTWRFFNRDEKKAYIREFDLVVMCTFALRNLVGECKDIAPPILWWLHEAEAIYQRKEFSDYGENVFVYCGGKRAQRSFQAYSKRNNTQILQYCIPDEGMMEEKGRLLEKDKISFGVIGILHERKAQDILLRAILQLPKDYQDKIDILIIGKIVDKVYWEEQKTLLRQLKNVKIMGEMSQRELAQQYRDIDVLVCPSRDDPMPIVVTQALMYGKTCIVSKNVGQMEFVESGVNGFVFETEEELAGQIAWIVDHKEKLCEIGKRGRSIYERNFSEEIMEEKLAEFWRKNCE